MDCIFCQIAQHKIPSEILAEDDRVMVFKDINPKANVHWLIVPKKHIRSVSAVEADDWNLILEIVKKAAALAKESGLAGYKLVFNVGREGGQIVDHLHLHLLSGGSVSLP